MGTQYKKSRGPVVVQREYCPNKYKDVCRTIDIIQLKAAEIYGTGLITGTKSFKAANRSEKKRKRNG